MMLNRLHRLMLFYICDAYLLCTNQNRNSSIVRYWIDIDNLSYVNYFELFFLTREKVFNR